MVRLFVILLFNLLLVGVGGCANSECQKVRDLEIPAYETLLESEKWLAYWENEASLERAKETNVCRDTLRLNKKTLKVEKTGEVCIKETGVNTERVSKAVQNARTRYEETFSEWQKIVKLYPDCFDPEKVIRANS